MNGELRRAGRGLLPGGAVVVWSVAEGRRGRRWRWTLSREGRLHASVLAEIDDRGLFNRLELATAVGLLTFHPEPDGASAHGNVLTSAGVRPIAVPWQAGWGIAIEGDPFGSTVASGTEAMLLVEETLTLRPAAGTTERLTLDERGIPVLDGALEWPLEE